MKVLQLGKFWPGKGGLERVMIDLVEGISGRGIDCDMLTVDVEKNRCREIVLNNHSRILCVSSLFTLCATMISPAMVKKLRQIQSQYDIIHIHHPDPMAAFALWLSGFKGKVVLHWHSDILKQKIALKFFLPLQNWLIKRSDLILTTSPVYLKHSPYLQSSFANAAVLPIGIDAISPDPDGVESIRKQYRGKKIIFSLGRLVGYKGFNYLIEAAQYLSDDYVVLIGGAGVLQQKLQRQIQQQGLVGKVVLLGRIPNKDIPNYYGACDVFVMSSIWKTEAFGIVLLEALSAGKPIVATKIKGSGVSWVNEDGVTGVNVEPENGRAIADAVCYILSERSRYETYSHNAKKRYTDIFGKDMMIDKCLEFYKQLS